MNGKELYELFEIGLNTQVISYSGDYVLCRMEEKLFNKRLDIRERFALIPFIRAHLLEIKEFRKKNPNYLTKTINERKNACINYLKKLRKALFFTPGMNGYDIRKHREKHKTDTIEQRTGKNRKYGCKKIEVNCCIICKYMQSYYDENDCLDYQTCQVTNNAPEIDRICLKYERE